MSSINSNKAFSLRFKHSQFIHKGKSGGSIRPNSLPESVKNIVNNFIFISFKIS